MSFKLKIRENHIITFRSFIFFSSFISTIRRRNERREYSGNQKLARQGCQIHERSIISHNDWRPWCVCAQSSSHHFVLEFNSCMAIIALALYYHGRESLNPGEWTLENWAARMKQQRQPPADQQSVSNPQPRSAPAIYGIISPVFNRKSSLVCNSNRALRR